ncbi:MAG: glycosyltransferase family 1 protein, partial [Ferruginibacter sp.]
KFLVVGNINNSFGKKMISKYGADRRLIFCGAVFDKTKIGALRKYSKLYFHGHSVGGTNPSLLEAMADGVLIAAHGNEFNRAVLQSDALYFNTAAEVHRLIDESDHSDTSTAMPENNLQKIKEQFSWPAIVNSYEALFLDWYNKKKR